MVIAKFGSYVGTHPVSCSDLDTLPSTIAGISNQAMATLLLSRHSGIGRISGKEVLSMHA